MKICATIRYFDNGTVQVYDPDERTWSAPMPFAHLEPALRKMQPVTAPKPDPISVMSAMARNALANGHEVKRKLAAKTQELAIPQEILDKLQFTI